jgi:hypothetical protein
MNLDIGLPVERLHQPIRAGLAGEPAEPIAMPAVNRRGRAIDCVVRVTSLVGTDDEVIGVILLMDAHDGVTGPDALLPTEHAALADQSDADASSPASMSDMSSDDS